MIPYTISDCSKKFIDELLSKTRGQRLDEMKSFVGEEDFQKVIDSGVIDSVNARIDNAANKLGENKEIFLKSVEHFDPGVVMFVLYAFLENRNDELFEVVYKLVSKVNSKIFGEDSLFTDSLFEALLARDRKCFCLLGVMGKDFSIQNFDEVVFSLDFSSVIDSLLNDKVDIINYVAEVLVRSHPEAPLLKYDYYSTKIERDNSIYVAGDLFFAMYLQANGYNVSWGEDLCHCSGKYDTIFFLSNDYDYDFLNEINLTDYLLTDGMLVFPVMRTILERDNLIIKNRLLNEVYDCSFANQYYSYWVVSYDNSSITFVDGDGKLYSESASCEVKYEKLSYWTDVEDSDSIYCNLNSKKYIYDSKKKPENGVYRLEEFADICGCIDRTPYYLQKKGNSLNKIIVSGFSDCITNRKLDIERNTAKRRYKCEKVVPNSILISYLDNVKFLRIGDIVTDIYRTTDKANIVFKQEKPVDIDDNYFLCCLSSDFVKEQLLANVIYWYGNILCNVVDFEKILIQVDANRITSTLNERYQKEANEIEKEKSANLEEYKKNIRSRKHRLGNDIGALNQWWDTLNCDCPDLRDEYKDIFDGITKSLNKVTSQISNLCSNEGMEKEKIVLSEFINDYIKDNPEPFFNYKFNSKQDKLSWGNRMEKRRFFGNVIDFPKEALRMIFDNIRSNARDHGFKGREGMKNIIKFEYLPSDDSNIICLAISNNGNPLIKGMTFEKIKRFGETSDPNNHSGLGGNEIQELMEEFGGKKFVIESSEVQTGFPVTYKLYFNRYY